MTELVFKLIENKVFVLICLIIFLVIFIKTIFIPVFAKTIRLIIDEIYKQEEK